jgi:hypothetical protein
VAVQLLSGIREIFGEVITLQNFFEVHTTFDLSSLIKKRMNSSIRSIIGFDTRDLYDPADGVLEKYKCALEMVASKKY